MVILYEEVAAAQAKIEDKLLEDSNVVSIGVVEEIDDFGRKTGNYVIQVGVVSIEAYQNTIKRGNSVIPPEYILHSENNKQEKKHIRINVVKEGKIEALLSSTVFEKETKKPVGLLFAGGETASFFNPLKTLLFSSSQFHVNHYSTGKTHVFSKDYSFTIIKRSYSTMPSRFFKKNTKIDEVNFKKINTLPKKTMEKTTLFKPIKPSITPYNFSAPSKTLKSFIRLCF